MRQYVTAGINGYLFGIDAAVVREVNRSTDITSVALAPDYVAGLMNLRGQIITIIDPGYRLGLDKCEIKSSSRCIVLKTNQEISQSESMQTNEITSADTVGLLVDKIADMVTIDEKDIEPPPPNVSDFDSKMITGVVKLKDNLMIVLKMKDLLLIDK